MKRYVAASFMNQVSKCSGDREVRQTNEGIGNHVSPHQSRFAKVAIQMGQEIRTPESDIASAGQIRNGPTAIASSAAIP